MTTFKKLSVLAIAALLVTGISGVSTVAGTAKVPTTTTCLTATSLTDFIMCLINSVGDDTFSTVDLTTLVNSVTSLAPAQHYMITTTSPSSSGTSTQHYGPYDNQMTTDIGTCNNQWADDTWNRGFTVFFQSDSIVVVQQSKDGSFSTPSTYTPPPAVTPQSPGACNNGASYDGDDVVAPGVTGSFHGYFVFPLPSGAFQTSTNPNCNPPGPNTTPNCSTRNFINSHFSCPPAPMCWPFAVNYSTASAYFFHYTAPITATAPNSALILNEHKDASPNRGGQSGDILSST